MKLNQIDRTVLCCLSTRTPRRVVLSLFILALALLLPGGSALADVQSTDLTVITTTGVALRQEIGQPIVEPQALTLTVSGGTTGRSIGSVALSFHSSGFVATGQYDVVSPSFPVSVSASQLTSLVFKVTPKPTAAVFVPIEIKASVTATDTGTSTSASASTTTQWTVSPGNSTLYGQRDNESLIQLLLGMNTPSGVATDGTRMFVVDKSNHRVLIYNTVPTSDQAAADIVVGQPGFFSFDSNHGSLTVNNELIRTASGLSSPESVLVTGGKLLVSDTGNHRILIWNTIPTSHFAAADVVLGQADFTTALSNRGSTNGTPGANTLSFPTGLASNGTKLFVADRGNGRVLIWNTIPTSNGTAADNEVGRLSMTDRFTRIVSNKNMRAPEGVLIVGTKMLVSDTGNSRILVWNTIPTSDYVAADLVIGQPDFDSLCISGCVGQFALSSPKGIATAGDKLIVADYGNSRVLIYNSFPTANQPKADVVVGKVTFTGSATSTNKNFSQPSAVAVLGTKLLVADSTNHRVAIFNSIPVSNFPEVEVEAGQPTNATRSPNFAGVTARTFGDPRGLASDGTNLVVADTVNNRILILSKAPTTNLTDANVVLGQTDFFSRSTGSSANGSASATKLRSPRDVHLQSGKLIVADTSNNRVLIWNTVPTSNAAPADVVLGQVNFTDWNANQDPDRFTNPAGTPSASTLSFPQGVFYDGTKLFVADSSNSRVLIWNSLPTSNATSADVVVGHTDFARNSTGLPTDATLSTPAAVVAAGGRLFVADSSRSTVSIWNTIPTSNGQASDIQLKLDFGRPFFGASPEGLLVDGTRLFVSSRNLRRVLVWDSLPTADNQPPTGIIGQKRFTETNSGLVSPHALDGPAGMVKLGDDLWIADHGLDRVGRYALPLRSELTFSQSDRLYKAETFAVTATFSQLISPTAPKIRISGPSGANVTGPVDMTIVGGLAVASPLASKTWTYSRQLVAGNDGFFQVTFDATDTFGRVLPSAPSGNRFEIDTVPPDAPVLTFSRGPAFIASGPLTITVSYAEPVGVSPTLVFSGPAASSGRFIGGNTRSDPVQISSKLYVFTLSVGSLTPTTGETYTATVGGGAQDLAGNSAPDGSASGVVDTNVPSAPTLTFSRGPALLTAGAFSITADYDQPLAISPTLTFTGVAATNGRFSGGNVLSNPTAISSTRYVYSVTVAGATAEAGESYTATVDGGKDSSENPQASASAGSGIVDTTAPQPPTLTFSKGPAGLTAGAFTVTADYGESINVTPTLTFSGVAATNGRFSGGNVFSSPSRVGQTRFVFSVTTTGTTDQAGEAYAAAVGGATDLTGAAQTADATATGVVDTNAPPVPLLTFSSGPGSIGAGPLSITVDYAEPIDSTPTLSLSGPAPGVGLFGSSNTLTNPTRISPTRFVYTLTVAGITSQLGEAYAASVNGATDLVGNAQAGPAQAAGAVDTTGPAAPRLSFSRGPGKIGSGLFSITALYAESIGTAPTLVMTGTAAASSRFGSSNTFTQPMRVDSRSFAFMITVTGTTDQSGEAFSASVSQARDEGGNVQVSAITTSGLIETSPPIPTITYGQPKDAVVPGPLAITATFNEPLSTPPAISIDRGGFGNDTGLRIMTATADPAVWTFVYTVLPALGTTIQNGTAMVSISQGRDVAGNLNGPAVNGVFAIGASGPNVALTYSKDRTKVPAGNLTITATFTEAIVTTPTIAIVAPGGANSQAATFMSATGSSSVWTFTQNITSRRGADGEATVIISNALNAAGEGSRPPTNGTFSVLSSAPPVARIAAVQFRAGPRAVSLNGTGSTAGVGYGLTYAWTLTTKPAAAVSFSSSQATTSYQATPPGTYTFTLSVFDEALRASSATLTVQVDNRPPTPDVRGDRDVLLSRSDVAITVPTTLSVTLDATGSTDPDGDAVTYTWTIISAPDQSAGGTETTTLVTLSSRTTPEVQAVFVGTSLAGTGSPLIASGSYRFRVTVSDGRNTSFSDIRVVALDPLNLLPVADPGLDRNITITRFGPNGIQATIADATLTPPDNLRNYVRLDGRNSADPGGRAITYSWSLSSVPAGSSLTTLTDPRTAFPRFTPDKDGPYDFALQVSNGILPSVTKPVEIIIQSANHAPTAVAIAEDLATLRQTSLTTPVLVVNVGDTVTLNGSNSLDIDVADRASLVYSWSQLEGSSVTFSPDSTRATITFVPALIGRMKFQITVTDPTGASSRDRVEVAVLPSNAAAAASLMPLLSIVSSATTTTTTGEHVSDGISLGRPRSLRVTLPTTVTLSGSISGNTTSGQRFDFVWTQTEGPSVLLSSIGAEGTASKNSVTSFTPTTSRVHVFELTVFPLDGAGSRTGLFVTRRVRIIVNSTSTTVPEATASAAPATIPLTGTPQDRLITLDGTGSTAFQQLVGSGQTLVYLWRQLSGPSGVIANANQAVTTFQAPELESNSGAQQYYFELTVDLSPPGDRSEPFVVLVQQGAAAAVPAAGATGGTFASGGGGGCSLPLSTGPAGGVGGGLLLLPLAAWLMVRRRRRLTL